MDADNSTGQLKISIKKNGQLISESEFNEFPIIFGRNTDCELSVTQSPFISRIHGAIALNGNEITIKDLGSSNGFKVNGVKQQVYSQTEKLAFQIEDLSFEVSVVQAEPHLNENDNISVIRVAPQSQSHILLDSLKLPQAPKPSPTSKSSSSSVSSVSSISSVSAPGHTGTKDSSTPKVTNKSKTSDEGVHFTVAPFLHIETVPSNLRTTQAVLTWDGDIYSVHNFENDEPFILGNKVTNSLYLPTVTKNIDFGLMKSHSAYVRLSSPENWTLYNHKIAISQNELVTKKRLMREKNKNNLLIQLDPHDVLSIDLGNGLNLHFRYVKRPLYYLPKTLIENKEEVKKALFVSFIIHAVISMVALFSAPKVEAPKIANVPPRIAKLLVTPPVQIIATPTPTPTPAPTPEPTPEPTPTPSLKPTPKPKVPKKEIIKPVPQKKILAPKPMQFKRPPQKVNPEPQVAPPPKITPEQEQAQELSKLFETMPGPPVKGSGLNKGEPIKISKSSVHASGIKVSGVSVADSLAQTKSSNVGGGVKNGFDLGTSSGAIKFSTKGQGGVAGKRKVEGAVLGTPSMNAQVGTPQGLDNATIMKVVNTYLGDVQRCYERALFEDGSLKGRIEYEWDIIGAGGVTEVRIISSQMARSDTLNNCIIKVFKKMKFPKSKNGLPTTAKIGFPFGQ